MNTHNIIQHKYIIIIYNKLNSAIAKKKKKNNKNQEIDIYKIVQNIIKNHRSA